jgi:hypothetical protein
VYLQMVGGLLLVASTFFHWAGRGSGSALTLGELGDLALGGRASSALSRWTGLVLYLIPISGALIVVGAGIDRPLGRRLSLGATIVAAVLVTGAFVLVVGNDRGLRAGELVASIGLALAITGEWWSRHPPVPSEAGQEMPGISSGGTWEQSDE